MLLPSHLRSLDTCQNHFTQPSIWAIDDKSPHKAKGDGRWPCTWDPQVPGPQGLALDFPAWPAAPGCPAHLAGNCKAAPALERPLAPVHTEKRQRCETDVRNPISGELAHAGHKGDASPATLTPCDGRSHPPSAQSCSPSGASAARGGHVLVISQRLNPSLSHVLSEGPEPDAFYLHFHTTVTKIF